MRQVLIIVYNKVLLVYSKNGDRIIRLNSTAAPRISARTIEGSRLRIGAEFLDSRQLEHKELSGAIGVQLVCKIESENIVGSFNGRGADSFVNALPTGVKALVSASAGNFGLALAYAGKKRGIEVTVNAAETASPGKNRTYSVRRHCSEADWMVL
jgi:threonine dehydratase